MSYPEIGSGLLDSLKRETRKRRGGELMTRKTLNLSLLSIILVFLIAVTPGLLTDAHATKTATCSITLPPSSTAAAVDCGHCGEGTITVTVSATLVVPSLHPVSGYVSCGNAFASCSTLTTCTASTTSTAGDTLTCYANPSGSSSGVTATCEFPR